MPCSSDLLRVPEDGVASKSAPLLANLPPQPTKKNLVKPKGKRGVKRADADAEE